MSREDQTGNGYTVELIAQYEGGREVVMETWPVVDMLAALHADLSMVEPQHLLGRMCTASGCADLTDRSRKAVDQIIGMILKGQSRDP